ncbi:hypothetical protein IFM89_022055, partial [Coptis chinensis]
NTSRRSFSEIQHAKPQTVLLNPNLLPRNSHQFIMHFFKLHNMFPVKPVFSIVVFFLSLLLVVILLSPSTTPFPVNYFYIAPPSSSSTQRKSDIWSVPRLVEWRPCKWWIQGHLTPLPKLSNGFIRVDCYGGLNQMRRDLCDGIGVARLLNATLVLPKFEVAAYWNESSAIITSVASPSMITFGHPSSYAFNTASSDPKSSAFPADLALSFICQYSGFADVFDVDYFIQEMKNYITVLKTVPEEIALREPVRVDCSKRKGHFDYIESVLPLLLEHRYISITPAASQRRDRYPLYAKAALCQGCYKALRLTESLEKKGSELLDAIPKPFLSLHLRFEPDMVAYSQCEYQSLSAASRKAISSAQGDRKPWTGEMAHIWRSRGKCPPTPNETAFILKALAIPTNTTIYLAAGDGLMEIDGLTSVYTNVYTKSSLLSGQDFTSMHGNTKAALDYYVSVNSDSYVATYFGNMDKMVSAMRTFKGLFKTLFLSRRAFAELISQGYVGVNLLEALWKVHRDDFILGRGSALPDCFCEWKL